MDLREWLPENHLVHFIIEAVERLDLSAFKVNETGSGSGQYPPMMMVKGRVRTGCLAALTRIRIATQRRPQGARRGV
ncbi:MAG: hypothetical protein LBK83_03130 [Treponema sp.]|nr:hypothetical protein [Treponema sp.]